jgi:putative transposase
VLKQPERVNEAWSMDFMSDALLSGQRLRTLNIIDDFNREVLAIEVDTSLPAKRVVRVLSGLPIGVVILALCASITGLNSSRVL